MWTCGSHHLISLYNDLDDDSEESDPPFQYGNTDCDYFEPGQFNAKYHDGNKYISYFQLNCRGLSANWDSFRNLICDMHGESFPFGILGISAIFKCQDDERLSLPGYHKLITQCRDNGLRGGVGLFIKDNINYMVREDVKCHYSTYFWIPIYWNHTAQWTKHNCWRYLQAKYWYFSSTLFDIMNLVNRETKHCVITGDMNIDLLKFGFHNKNSDYRDNIFSHGFLPTITKPTRISHTSATLIDHISTNNIITIGKSGINLCCRPFWNLPYDLQQNEY